MNELKITRMTLGMAVLLLVGMTALGGWAHWQLVSKARAELAQIRTQIATRQQKISQSDTAAQLQKLDEQLQALDQIIATDNEATRLMEKFSRTLADMSLTQRSVTSGQAVRLRSMEQVPIHVSFGGSFESVFNLLSRFESSRPAVRLQQLVVRGDPAVSGQPLMVNAAFVTFHRSGDEGLVSIANGAR